MCAAARPWPPPPIMMTSQEGLESGFRHQVGRNALPPVTADESNAHAEHFGTSGLLWAFFGTAGEISIVPSHAAYNISKIYLGK